MLRFCYENFEVSRSPYCHAASYHGIVAIRRSRKQVLEDLVQQICNGVVHPVERYCVSFPTPLAHSDHVVSEFEEPTQDKMNSFLFSQLIHRLNRRVVLLDEIQRNLQTFVQDNHTRACLEPE